MRKLQNLGLFLLVMMVLMSCKDSEKQQAADTALLMGDYKGYMQVKVNQLTMGDEVPARISIDRSPECDCGVSLQLKNFSFMGINIGDINLPLVKTMAKASLVKLSGETEVALPAPMNKCKIRVDGEQVRKMLDLVMHVDVAALNQQVKVLFKGVKLEGLENAETKILNIEFPEKGIQLQGIDHERGEIQILLDAGVDRNFLVQAPVITLSKGATVRPASGVEQDFSADGLTYTVIAENGTTKEYRVVKVGKSLNLRLDDWVQITSSTAESNERYMSPRSYFGTSNAGVMQINEMFGKQGARFEYPVEPFSVGSDEGAVLTTRHTLVSIGGLDYNKMLNGMIPYITSGSLFLGTFQLDMFKPLKSTKFGVSFEGIPTTLSGQYSYVPGEVYYNNKNEVQRGQTDQCVIYAALYEEELDSRGKNIPLTGDYNDEKEFIGTSPRVVMRAVFEQPAATDRLTDFSVPFVPVEGKSYDKAKKYYLVLVCASSAKGDHYEGAPGSCLKVRRLQVASKP